MSGAEDPYEVLGVGTDATPEQIARAFRRLARRYHPDTGEGDRSGFARIRAAYETLTDPRRRTGQDTHQPTAQPRRGARIPVRVRSPSPRRGADTTARLALDLAEAVYGTNATVDLGDRRMTVRIPAGATHGQRLRLREQGEPGRHGGPPGDLLVTVLVAEHPVYRRSGQELHTTLTVSYPEAVLGAEVPITTLGGTELPVTVPPGTAPGDRLRLAGHGVPARGQYAAGDLLVEIALDIPAGLAPSQRTALARLAGTLPPPRKDPRR
ncbi:J domain-containing protein [Allosalinactinospora lopnorensis]|uniref:J domain-containing protein n=1 Tax=Allosalinactinospora lopnorensis TaxID=1352348 RepID=UPI000697E0B7|nr:DnaJ C-terminal domain-containing protein [Allosalinactinospora lopnorensis]